MNCKVMLTTFDNPYDPFDQFTLWWMFDVGQGYDTCGFLDRISHYSDDMSDEEINKEHERAIEEIIDNDFLNIYKKVERNKNKAG